VLLVTVVGPATGLAAVWLTRPPGSAREAEETWRMSEAVAEAKIPGIARGAWRFDSSRAPDPGWSLEDWEP